MILLPPGIVLARLGALTDPSACVVDIDHAGVQASVLVTRRGGVVAAFVNQCPHAGYPLQRSDGRLVVQEGQFVICAAHFASFRLEDGACAGGPCNGKGLTPVPVVLIDDLVQTA